MTDPKDQDAAPSDDAGPTPSDVSSSSDAEKATTEESPSAASDSTESNDETESPDNDSGSTEDASDGDEEGGDKKDGGEEGGESDGEKDSDEKDGGEEELPEWEPLSPEIVEDEAIRGDFMLRWAVILLAFLLGCRHITDTVTLVRIRTGEYLASNGILPPANDVFSYTASERPWVNLGWLFDLLIAGVYGVGGAAGLTLFTAFVGGATFYFLHGISRENLPTWWTSVCVGVALLMANLQFTALPQLITLLGVAWVLRGLHAWSQTGKQSTLWCLAGSLAVWSNLDPRAFIGWLILLAWLVGTAIAQKSGRRALHENASMKGLAMATAAGFVALMINPFGWHAILSPIQLYGVELPALAEYAGRISFPHELQLVPLFDSAVWDNLNQHTVAALVIAVVAAATNFMNSSRLNIGLLAAYVVVLGLSIASSHELGTLTLVSCVLAGLNGQDWYRANCRQEYTIETMEVLWSRAGRAVTVLGFAAIAFLAISGRLMGPNGRRVGLGFSPALAATIDAAKEEAERLPEGRIFTFRLDLADVLLWHGVPSFVDSRIGVFTGGEKDILKVHNQARYALRRKPALPAAVDTPGKVLRESDAWLGRKELWQEPFDQYQVAMVTARMWGATPDYNSYFDLIASTDWDLVELGASAAFFQRANSNALTARSNLNLGFFRKLAFDDCRTKKDFEPRVEWPRPASSYQQFLSLPSPPVSNLSQRARHELAFLSAVVNGALPMEQGDALGLAVLALRDAAAGISEEANNSQAYSIQADVQGILEQIETSIQAQYQLGAPSQQRYYQRLYAMRQALVVDPEQLQLLYRLAQLYNSTGRSDFAFEMTERGLAVIRKLSDSELTDQVVQISRQLNQMKQQLGPNVEAVDSRIEEAKKAENFDRIQLALALSQGGYPQRALQLLEEDRLSIAGNQLAELQLAFLLAEAGRMEEAAGMFATFEQMGSAVAIPLEVVLQSCWLDMALGDYRSAARRCTERVNVLKSASTQALMATGPFAMPSPQFLGEANIWPATHTLVASQTLLQTSSEISLLQWTSAMANLEAGECAEAAAALKALIDDFPESQFRPLVKVWLNAITGEAISDSPPDIEPGIRFNDDSDLVARPTSATETEDAAPAETSQKDSSPTSSQ